MAPITTLGEGRLIRNINFGRVLTLAEKKRGWGREKGDLEQQPSKDVRRVHGEQKREKKNTVNGFVVPSALSSFNKQTYYETLVSFKCDCGIQVCGKE